MNPTVMKAGTLRFVASADHYSIYTTSDGEEVMLAHGSARRLVPAKDLDLRQLWIDFNSANVHASYLWGYNQSPFMDDHLPGLTFEPEKVEFCVGCYYPHHEDEVEPSGEGEPLCSTCFMSWPTCAECEQTVRTTWATVDDERVCESCRENRYRYCDPCDGYYHHDSEHNHDRSTCCESPAQQFLVRNNGDDPLPNDTRVTVTLPGGVISEEGLSQIRTYVRERYYYVPDTEGREHYVTLSRRLNEIGNQWQTKEGNYTKRLSRFAYKQFGLKLSPEVVSQVGCIAREQSTAVEHHIETTRNLNLPREQFAHSGSCWWTEYAESRCAFKTNGGFGLRTFNPDSNWVAGRIWVLPLKARERANGARPASVTLTPTFETEAPDAFILFNGYGNLEGYTGPRIVAHMAGMTYLKIGFEASPMYVNNESGYLVTSEEIAQNFNRDSFLQFNLQEHADLFSEEQAQNTTEKEQTNVA